VFKRTLFKEIVWQQKNDKSAFGSDALD